jgi:hypothetical protein
MKLRQSFATTCPKTIDILYFNNDIITIILKEEKDRVMSLGVNVAKQLKFHIFAERITISDDVRRMISLAQSACAKGSGLLSSDHESTSGIVLIYYCVL